MTMYEAIGKIRQLCRVFVCVSEDDGYVDIHGILNSHDLRAIADILDQVGKEEKV
jgi:uncharacterized protein (UPF0548 family)